MQTAMMAAPVKHYRLTVQMFKLTKEEKVTHVGKIMQVEFNGVDR
jgi:hypothetical protein